MFGLFGNRQSTSGNFLQVLARLIASNLEGRAGSDRADTIARSIAEATYSFEGFVGGAYDPLVEQYGPYLISPIVFVLATKSWKIEHIEALNSIIYRQIGRHGFLVAKYICQSFDYGIWSRLRDGLVQGSKIHNGYVIKTYYSAESAMQVANEARRYVFWIAACGLCYFLALSQESSSSRNLYLTYEEANLLRTARQAITSFPDQSTSWGGRKVFDDRDRELCVEAIDARLANSITLFLTR